MSARPDGATWPIAVLTSAFCPEFDPQRLAMAMCVGYFKGEQAGRGPASTFCVSGLVSSKIRWREFEQRWTGLLRHEGLTTFNACNFLAGTGEFSAGRSDLARRRRVIDALGRLVEQHILRAFTHSISLIDYHAVDEGYAFGEAAGGPYAVCAALMMANVRRWMAEKHPGDLTLFIFEQGDIEQRELRRVLKATGAEAGEPPQMWPRQWLDERRRQRYLRPLEAVELFAADREGLFVRRLVDRSLLESHIIDTSCLAQISRALAVASQGARHPGEDRTALETGL